MRMIDADALKERLPDLHSGIAEMLCKTVFKIVDSAPTIQLPPNDQLTNVKTAHWIDNADSYICSQCGYECNNPNNERYGAAVCPRCLAEIEEGTM